jgi:hypothetical protein
MAIRERVYRITDAPMTWTKAILCGLAIWVLLILLTGQLPSWIIYEFDKRVGQIIELSQDLPFINEEGLNPKQIAIIRDIVANTVQMGAFVVFLIVAYFWQEKKNKRLGRKGLQDPVRGYLSGK